MGNFPIPMLKPTNGGIFPLFIRLFHHLLPPPNGGAEFSTICWSPQVVKLRAIKGFFSPFVGFVGGIGAPHKW